MSSVRWNIAGNCKSPHITWVMGYAERDDPDGRGSGPKMELILETRCRDCEECRAQRRNLWKHRMRAEAALWPCTWMGSLTFRPEEHHRLLSQARVDYLPSGDFDALDPAYRWRYLERYYWREVSLSLKRLRTTIGPHGLRHCAITEAHQSGLPHYHVLYHQCDIARPLRHSTLAGSWEHGFTNFKLVKDVAGATYAAKYLGKSLLARVRASQAYGETVSTDYSALPELLIPPMGELDPLTTYAVEEWGRGPISR